MTTAIASAAVERLKWIADQLAKLHDNTWVRYEGEPVFRLACQELDDIIATATEPVTEVHPPATVLNVMTEDQVDALGAAIVKAIPPATDVGALEKAITEQIEASDVALLDAIAQTRADVLGAIPAPAPAVTGELAA